jgi:hypothetical protein
VLISINTSGRGARFWHIVYASRAPEDAGLADLIELIGNPDAMTPRQITGAAQGDFEASFMSLACDVRVTQLVNEHKGAHVMVLKKLLDMPPRT